MSYLVRQRPWLLVLPLLVGGASTTACAAIWGFQDSLEGGPGDGGTPDGSRDSRGNGGDGSEDADAYDAPVIVDAPPPSDAPVAQPCTATAPETYAYYVAEHGGSDDTTCGLLSAPCHTIHMAITNAIAVGSVTIVNVAEGSYGEQVILSAGPAGLTVVGGWLYDGSKWARDTSSDARTKLVVQPTTESMTVVAKSLAGPAATLCTMTLESKPAADAGETLYGVFATGASSLVLSDVDIEPGPGGDGIAGPKGSSGAAGDNGGCTTPGTGGAGTPSGPAGMPALAGTFDSSGYQPGNGGIGGSGTEGSNGTSAPNPPCVTCVTCTKKLLSCSSTDSSQCGNDGLPGCAGGPGDPGGAGGGGGSSVGVFAWQATVTISGSQLVAGNGGDGATGGAGGNGGNGSNGVTGKPGTACDTVCSSSCVPTTSEAPKGSTGGNGGNGSSGGVGGGGSGGFSCPIVTGGDAGVTVMSTTPKSGVAGLGASGAPSGGIGNDAGVCSF